MNEDLTVESVTEALKQLIDPEAGISVVDLGMLHEVQITETSVSVALIPTSPGCPLLQAMTDAAESILTPLIGERELDVLWRLDLPWDASMIPPGAL